MRRAAAFFACGAALISTAVLAEPAVGLEPTIAPSACDASPFRPDLTSELSRRWPHNRFTAAVIDLRSGCEYSYRPDLRLTTASVFKAEVLAAVLLRAQAGDRDPTAREHELVWPMITESANRPTSILYREFGGAAGFGALNSRLGLGETEAAPSVWGLTRTSARDQAHLARQLLVGDVGPFSARSVDTAWRYMGAVVPSQQWGVGEGLPPALRFGLKNGFAPSRCCGWRINTAGVVLDPRGGGWALAILTDRWGSEAAGRSAISFMATWVNQKMVGQPLVDVVALKRSGEQGVELHGLAGSDSYRSFRIQAGTGLTAAANDWSFDLGDHDADARSDLLAVKHLGESGGAEVHVLSGASGWRDWTAHAPTGLGPIAAEGWRIFAADYNRDRVDDVFAISMQGKTGTEVHVLDGRSGFRTFLAHHATALPATSADAWSFELADVDRDGHQDVLAMSHAGSRGTEAHVLSGASGYRTFLLHAETAFPATRPAEWAFAVSDRRGDGLPDLVALARNGRTGTEAHVLDGATSWSTFNLHAPTALHATAGEEWAFLS